MKKLQSDLSFAELRQMILNRQNVEFEATPSQLNLTVEKAYTHEKTFEMPPINPPEELINIIITNNSINFNHLIILTYMYSGKITYRYLNDDSFRVQFRFPTID